MSSRNLLDSLPGEYNNTYIFYGRRAYSIWKSYSQCEHSLGRYKQKVKRRKIHQPYNQSSKVPLINIGEPHSTSSLGFAPSSLASCPPPPLNAHLLLSILQMLMIFTFLSWVLFFCHPTYFPLSFASVSIGLHYHAIYGDIAPIFNSKPGLPPTPHTIKFNCLLDDPPWTFHKYLKFSVSKTQPIAFTTKSAFLSLSSMLLK